MAGNVAQHKILNLLKTLWDIFVITCHNIFNVWPKTTLLLPVWHRDTKKLDIPVTWTRPTSALLCCRISKFSPSLSLSLSVPLDLSISPFLPPSIIIMMMCLQKAASLCRFYSLIEKIQAQNLRTIERLADSLNRISFSCGNQFSKIMKISMSTLWNTNSFSQVYKAPDRYPTLLKC